MTKCLILHGWGGNSEQNWFPWLERKLNKVNIDTFIPNLPNTSLPVYDEQLLYLEKYKDLLNSGDLIIAHSLGCKLVLHFIEKYGLKGLMVILVAPAYSGLGNELGKRALGNAYESISNYFDEELKFDKLGNIYKIFLSNDDRFINMESAKKYYSQLENVEFIDFVNKGHFNQSSGVFEIPEILDYL